MTPRDRSPHPRCVLGRRDHVLSLRGLPISVSSAIGFIALSGIAVPALFSWLGGRRKVTEEKASPVLVSPEEAKP